MTAKWLQRAMYWPVVWRFAVRYAEKQPHTETEECIACLAQSRKRYMGHEPTVSPKRTIYCRVCGLDEQKWEKRVCPRRVVQVNNRQKHRPLFVRLVGWED